MADLIKLHTKDADELASYEPSDSEDDFTQQEKLLLAKVRRGREKHYEDSEDEVYGLPSSNESEDEVNMASDLDAQDGDSLPDSKAWGRRKKNFYHTDYVDDDHAGYQDKDVEAAECEEEEAREIQQRLMERLDDDDFILDTFDKASTAKEEEEKKEIIKADLTKLSKRQKLELLEKESPEFFNLVEDFKVKMSEVRDHLEPIMTLIKDKQIPPSLGNNFVTTKYHLILNYCTNIAFYLLLKSRRIPVQSHPIMHRLCQYRLFLKQLEELDGVMEPQFNYILETLKNGEKLQLVEEEKHISNPPKKRPYSPVVAANISGKSHEGTAVHMASPMQEDMLSDAGEKDEANEFGENKADKLDSKRAITYQIAKNKGLTPRRKKEQRNPRVKHRKKFLKAKIRRKGQVREPRKEIKKYAGEISGIKIGVSKSIKLK